MQFPYSFHKILLAGNSSALLVQKPNKSKITFETGFSIG
jgi:hypothetical protein